MKTSSFEPMLAADGKDLCAEGSGRTIPTIKELSGLSYPLLGSPKIDGIRCCIRNGKARSRSLLPIPNKHIRKTLRRMSLPAFDGELVINNAPWWKCTSGIMSVGGKPDFTYYVFDLVPEMGKDAGGYAHRLGLARKALSKLNRKQSKLVRLLPMKLITTPRQLLDYLHEQLKKGHEGIVVRPYNSQYKYGRSTLKQGLMIKFKALADDEAFVIGFEEELQNTNDAEKDVFGHTDRSQKKAGMKPKNTLGKFVVTSKKWKGEFRIGTGQGLTKELRKKIWLNQNDYIGRVVTYTYQVMGSKDAPRIPIFKGFRYKQDR